jgi:hypothetical protein
VVESVEEGHHQRIPDNLSRYAAQRRLQRGRLGGDQHDIDGTIEHSHHPRPSDKISKDPAIDANPVILQHIHALNPCNDDNLVTSISQDRSQQPTDTTRPEHGIPGHGALPLVGSKVSAIAWRGQR